MDRVLVIDQDRAAMQQLEPATLFARVAPGVPVVVVVPADAPLEARIAYELGGFRVLSRPVAVEDLIDKAAAPVGELGR